MVTRGVDPPPAGPWTAGGHRVDPEISRGRPLPGKRSISTRGHTSLLSCTMGVGDAFCVGMAPRTGCVLYFRPDHESQPRPPPRESWCRIRGTRHRAACQCLNGPRVQGVRDTALQLVCVCVFALRRLASRGDGHAGRLAGGDTRTAVTCTAVTHARLLAVLAAGGASVLRVGARGRPPCTHQLPAHPRLLTQCRREPPARPLSPSSRWPPRGLRPSSLSFSPFLSRGAKRLGGGEWETHPPPRGASRSRSPIRVSVPRLSGPARPARPPPPCAWPVSGSQP